MPQTIGVELELVGIGRRAAADVIAGVIGGFVEEIRDPPEPSEFWIMTKEGRWLEAEPPWKTVDDVSIHGPRSSRCELNTPILFETDLPLLAEVIDALAAAGAKVNTSCGVHVHVGSSRCEVEHFVRLLEAVAAVEPSELDRRIHDRRRLYARFMEPAFLGALSANRPKTWKDLWRLWYGTEHYQARMLDPDDSSRFRGLNLHSHATRTTVEFRYFNGSVDPEVVLDYVRFCLRLTEQAGCPDAGDTP